jgi:hypothetical protein
MIATPKSSIAFVHHPAQAQTDFREYVFLLRKLLCCPEGESLTNWIQDHWAGPKLNTPLWHLARAEEPKREKGKQ